MQLFVLIKKADTVTGAQPKIVREFVYLALAARPALAGASAFAGLIALAVFTGADLALATTFLNVLSKALCDLSFHDSVV